MAASRRHAASDKASPSTGRANAARNISCRDEYGDADTPSDIAAEEAAICNRASASPYAHAVPESRSSAEKAAR